MPLLIIAVIVIVFALVAAITGAVVAVMTAAITLVGGALLGVGFLLLVGASVSIYEGVRSHTSDYEFTFAGDRVEVQRVGQVSPNTIETVREIVRYGLLIAPFSVGFVVGSYYLGVGLENIQRSTDPADIAGYFGLSVGGVGGPGVVCFYATKRGGEVRRRVSDWFNVKPSKSQHVDVERVEEFNRRMSSGLAELSDIQARCFEGVDRDDWHLPDQVVRVGRLESLPTDFLETLSEAGATLLKLLNAHKEAERLIGETWRLVDEANDSLVENRSSSLRRQLDEILDHLNAGLASRLYEAAGVDEVVAVLTDMSAALRSIVAQTGGGLADEECMDVQAAFRVLGLPTDATLAQVKKMRIAQAKIFQEYQSVGEEGRAATEHMQRINHAYDVIKQHFDSEGVI